MILPQIQDHQLRAVRVLEQYWSRGKLARQRGDEKGPAADGAIQRFPSVEEIWEECLNAYNRRHGPEVTIERGRSARYLAWTHQHVQTILAELIAALFPVPDFFRVQGTTDAARQLEDQIQAEMEYLIAESGYTEKMRRLLLNVILYGNSPYMTDWQTRTIPVVTGLDPGPAGWRGVVEAIRSGVRSALKLEQAREERVVYNAPTLMVIDPRHVVYDPNPSADADPRTVWRILWERRTKAELKQRAVEFPGLYASLDNLDKLQVSDSGGAGAGDVDESDSLESSGITLGDGPDHTFQVKTFWGDIEIPMGDGDPLQLRNVQATWSGNTLLCFQYNASPDGFPPLQQLTYQEPGKPGQMYHVGAVEPGLGSQSLGNGLFNQFMDEMSKELKGGHLVRVGSYADLNPPAFGENWRVEDTEGEILPIPSNPALMRLEFLIPMVELIHAKAMGAQLTHSIDEQPRTATEQAQNKSTMDTRRKEVLKHLGNQSEQILRAYVALRRSFGPRIPMARQVDDPETGEKTWLTVHPDTFNHDFKIEVVGTGMLTEKAEQIAGLREVFGALVQTIPLLQNQDAARVQAGIIPLLERMYGMLTGLDKDTLIPELSEVERTLTNAPIDPNAESGDATGLPGAAELASIAGGA